ncbi:MAG: dihydrofolate reductase family protein [Calditrichia bacterium]
MKLVAYLAVSLDGYIADAEGSVDWLNNLPKPEGSDLGFSDFLSTIDAILMGANTFRTVQSFGMWPYTKPVFVLSHHIKKIPDGFTGKIQLVKGELKAVLRNIADKGFKNIYVDGGTVVQNCIAQNILDELIITHAPISLGGGIPLFPTGVGILNYEHLSTELPGAGFVKSHYRIIKRAK